MTGFLTTEEIGSHGAAILRTSLSNTGSTMSTGISAKSSPWLVGQPHLCAATLGILLRGLGPERICWGTDALWTGSPQWQIEGLRRLEIPEETQKNMGSNHWGVERGR